MATYYFNHWEVNGVNVGSANPASIGPILSDVVITAIYSEQVSPPPTPINWTTVAIIIGIPLLLILASKFRSK